MKIDGTLSCEGVYQTSDARLKYDVKNSDVEEDFKLLDRITVKEYKLFGQRHDHTNRGILAQELLDFDSANSITNNIETINVYFNTSNINDCMLGIPVSKESITILAPVPNDVIWKAVEN
jgi:hypothetical protein